MKPLKAIKRNDKWYVMVPSTATRCRTCCFWTGSECEYNDLSCLGHVYRPLNIDIDDDKSVVVEVDTWGRLDMQRHMVEEHRYYMGLDLKRDISLNEAWLDWVDSGLAAKFAMHVILNNEKEEK